MLLTIVQDSLYGRGDTIFEKFLRVSLYRGALQGNDLDFRVTAPLL